MSLYNNAPAVLSLMLCDIFLQRRIPSHTQALGCMYCVEHWQEVYCTVMHTCTFMRWFVSLLLRQHSELKNPNGYPLLCTYTLTLSQADYVCLCVCDGSGMFVGRDYTSDAHPLVLQFTEPRTPRRMFEWAQAWGGIYQNCWGYKWMRAIGSSS